MTGVVRGHSDTPLQQGGSGELAAIRGFSDLWLGNLESRLVDSLVTSYPE